MFLDFQKSKITCKHLKLEGKNQFLIVGKYGIKDYLCKIICED